MTNNGDLVNKCLRVENGHQKEYVVRVDKKITSDFLDKMSKGVKIYNPVQNKYVTTNPCVINKKGKNHFDIILNQGLNRQIRRMCEQLGYHVISLKRIRFMFLNLDVDEGKYRLLSKEELDKLEKVLN